MRKPFEQQLKLGMVPIGEVEVDLQSRHQLPAVLKGLQYIFVIPQWNKEAFRILEENILKNKQLTGRWGMSLWEILVLGVIRLSLEIDYDSLLDLANNHRTLREIMGVERSDFKAGKRYKLQTVVDNISLLSEDALRQLNELVVKAGHGIIREKEGTDQLVLEIKGDTFVMKKNIHFPTDLNLLWDCARKCMDEIRNLRKAGFWLGGWRELKANKRKFKKHYRIASEIHRKKGVNYQERLRKATQDYLDYSRDLARKIKGSIDESMEKVKEGKAKIKHCEIIKRMLYYSYMLEKHIDLVKRRIIEGEKIPHSDKVFSIFELETEWNYKGKAIGVELGHKELILSDQYQFIVHYEVIYKEVDSDLSIRCGQAIATCYQGLHYQLGSISFDRGFYSLLAKKTLDKLFPQVIMPKPGKKTAAQQEEESQESFVQLRKAHSTVEANINQLEHHGGSRCPDKGHDGFERYVGLGVLSYNLHHLGNLLIQQEREERKKLREAKQMKQAA